MGVSPCALSSHLLLLLCLIELWSLFIHILVYIYPFICSLPDRCEGRHLVEESTHTFDSAGHAVNSCCCLNLDVLLIGDHLVQWEFEMTYRNI